MAKFNDDIQAIVERKDKKIRKRMSATDDLRVCERKECEARSTYYPYCHYMVCDHDDDHRNFYH